MASRANGDIVRGLELAQTCDDLLASLLDVEEPIHVDVKVVHARLQALSILLRSIQHLESCGWLQITLQECSNVLNQLCAMVKTRPVGGASMIGQIDALTDVQNTLSLTSSLCMSNDELKDATMIKTIKQGLDTISSDLIAVVDDILPATPSAISKNTFKLHEAKLSINGDWNNSSSRHGLICSNSFIHDTGDGTIIKKLKFSCDCPVIEGSHDNELEYQVLSATYLVEHIHPGKERAWHMILCKPRINAIVSIIISGIPSSYVCEIDKLALSLAWQLSRGLTTGSKNKEIIIAEKLVYRLLSVSPPEAFLNKLPSQLEFNTSNKIVKLAWSPQGVQMRHYSVSNRVQDGYKTKSEFLPCPEFEMEIAKNSRETSNDDFCILVFRNSTITDGTIQGRPLWVTLSQVGMRQGGARFGISGISFGFDNKEGAVNWKSYVEAMRNRLQQLYAQRPLAFEYEAYHQTSTTLWQTFAPESSIRQDFDISVISSNVKGLTKNKMRMVVKRNGRLGSVCLDFDSSILKIAQRGLLGSLNLVNFWTYKDDGVNTPVVQQTNWKKLISRERNCKPDQPRSLGGPQVLSERKVSSDEWFDKIDQLKAVMELPASAKSTHKSIKICVIDTGFKLGVKGFAKIKMYKDFVNPSSTSMCDDTWHGTISANIIMSIYEQCELYVARVFKSDDTDDKTEPELMAQAIEWAITTDIDVDIISISAGFFYHSARLQDAVQKASAANKLVFAAASNWGNLGPVAFPARHNLYTICVFSTDTHNRASHFNPERRPDAHNFAILGEDFQHPGDANQRVRGTSTATAAAAGLAALIIDFARHQENYQSIFRVTDVSKMIGMIAISNAISERAGEFKCIMPLKLLPSDYTGMSLQQMREYIRDSLSRAMDQAN